MPLKHTTETVLVTVLALAIVVAGVVTAALPPLSVSVWPWTVAFALAVIYPLAVYPLLKSRRADYPFRALHAYPAFMLLVWLGLELSRSATDQMGMVQRSYIWGWSAGVVLIGLLLLFVFCLRVIRQRVRRGWVLGVIALLFVTAAFAGERYQASDRLSVAIASLTHGELPSLNLAESMDGTEESWRMKLRSMARREERMKARSSADAEASLSATVSAAASKKDTLIAAASSSKKNQATIKAPAKEGETNERVNVEPPPRLSKTGGEFELLALMMLAGYCGVIHQRARKRMA